MGLLKHLVSNTETINNGKFNTGSDGWDYGNAWMWDDGKMVFNPGSVSNLVENGTFTGGADEWDLTNMSYSSNKIITGSGITSLVSQYVGAEKGRWYLCKVTLHTIDINEITNLSVSFGHDQSGDGDLMLFENGTNNHTYNLVGWVRCSGEDGKIYIKISAYGEELTGAYIDNVEVYDKILGQNKSYSGSFNDITSFSIGGTTGSVDVYTAFETGSPNAIYVGNFQTGSDSSDIVHLDSKFIVFIPSDDFDGTIDNVSLRSAYIEPVLQVFGELEDADYLVKLKVTGTEGSIDVELTD